MCHWVNCCLLDVSNDHNTFIFTVKQSKKMLVPEALKCQVLLNHWHSFSSHRHVLQQQYVCCEAESKFSNYYSEENYTLKVNRN